MTEHFTLYEFIRSERAKAAGINNTPPDTIHGNIKITLEGLERVRKVLKQPIIILSGYRCTELNKLVKGSGGSQHIDGQAADIICPMFGRSKEVALMIEKHADVIKYDQLIFEGGSMGDWVHISFSDRDRRQALTKSKKGEYKRGIA